MGNRRRINVAFLTSKDPRNRNSWSGTYSFMVEALQKHCGDVLCLGPVNLTLPQWQSKALYLIDKASRRLLRKAYNYDHSIFISHAFSKCFESKISEKKIDLIFAPAASTEIAFLKTKIPIVTNFVDKYLQY
jgi:hypothetical protein